MFQSVSKSFQERLAAVGIPKDAFAALAGVHPSDVSRHSKGYHVAPARVKRMDAALVELEELVAADELKLNLSNVANIRAALARLAEKRANTAQATAPWSSCNATADFVEAPRGGEAGAILSSVTDADSQQ